MSDKSIPEFWQVNDPKRPSGERRDATLKGTVLGLAAASSCMSPLSPKGKKRSAGRRPNKKDDQRRQRESAQ